MDEVTQSRDSRGEMMKRADEARMRLVAVEIDAAAALLERAERAPDVRQRVAAVKEARATVTFASRFALPNGPLAGRLAELQARLEELSAIYLKPALLRYPPPISGQLKSLNRR